MDNELDYKYVITFIIIVKKKKKGQCINVTFKKELEEKQVCIFIKVKFWVITKQ